VLTGIDRKSRDVIKPEVLIDWIQTTLLCTLITLATCLSHKSGILSRQIGVKNFIRVVILDPRSKGHVIQRMRNPKIAMVRYVQYSQKVDL